MSRSLDTARRAHAGPLGLLRRWGREVAAVAELPAAWDELAQAIRLVSAPEALREEIGFSLAPPERVAYEPAIAAAPAALGASSFATKLHAFAVETIPQRYITIAGYPKPVSGRE